MALSSEDKLFLLDSILPKLLLSRKKRRIGVHEINKERSALGEYHHLFSQLKNHPDRFHMYTRMSLARFNYILEKISPRLIKTWCNWHVPILPEERLVITLRFLITGSSFRAIAFTFRVGTSTVADIVSENVDILWEELQPQHMPIPTKDKLISIAEDFYKLWNFPQCLGAIDGKDVRVRCPDNSGSMFYNYKKYFSVVLQAVVDANYKFLTVDVGGYGKQSDEGTFQVSDFYHAMKSGKFDLPEPAYLPQTMVKAPFVFVADEAYPLMPFLLKPFSGTCLPYEHENFNKRLSRCRKTVEYAFGILSSKWRLLNKPIETRIELVDSIVKCVCVLHNTILDREGMERTMTDVLFPGTGVVWNRTGRPSNDAKSVRDLFTSYFANNSLVYKK